MPFDFEVRVLVICVSESQNVSATTSARQGGDLQPRLDGLVKVAWQMSQTCVPGFVLLALLAMSVK
jgi:hypothetical protein